MRALLGFGALGLMTLIVLFRLGVARYRRSDDDPGLKFGSGLTVVPESGRIGRVQRFIGHDESKAVAAAQKAGQTSAQMAKNDRRARTPKPAKKAADVVDIKRRRG